MNKLEKFLIFFISFILVSIMTFTHHTTDVVVILLEFLTVLELIRMIVEYYIYEKRIKIRYLFDGAIFFCTKEIYLGFTHIHDNLKYITNINNCFVNVSYIFFIKF